MRESGPVGMTDGKEHVHLEGKETATPPLSQLTRGTVFDRAKSTPSTLSDEVEEPALSEGEVPGPLDRYKGPGRKRAAPKTAESESIESSEDGQDMKRRPRKSARLG